MEISFYRFVPYCSSDIWSGRRIEPIRGSTFTFMGAIIIKQIVKELLNMGMKSANSLILAGSRYLNKLIYVDYYVVSYEKIKKKKFALLNIIFLIYTVLVVSVL